MSGSDYELLDFGNARRLERFGTFILDRPCPAAANFSPLRPEIWSQADSFFEGREAERGRWIDQREIPQRWTIRIGTSIFELKRTEFGHLGIFPEQSGNWAWIYNVLKGSVTDESSEEKKKILNLFAYTGGSTLAAASAGASVVHLDAARNVVAWARRNAALSGLADAPIRWIAEDAVKFVKREIRRGNRYNAVILDPPSYGHGTHGEVWRLSKHLPGLLALCAELTAGRPDFILLTCHTPGYDHVVLAEMLSDAFGGYGEVFGQPLTIQAATGQNLPAGTVVRLIGR